MKARKQLHAIVCSEPSRTLRALKSMSLRSRRKNAAPGKRSETKLSEARPGVSFGKGFLARFAGSLCGAALLVCLAGGIPLKAQLARSGAQTGSRARVAGERKSP